MNFWKKIWTEIQRFSDFARKRFKIINLHVFFQNKIRLFLTKSLKKKCTEKLFFISKRMTFIMYKNYSYFLKWSIFIHDKKII